MGFRQTKAEAEEKAKAKQAAKAAEYDAKAAERRANGELAPVGSVALYVGSTAWGTLTYYATPDHDVWARKGGVIGRLSEFHVEFEQQATGATARQGKGGKQDGAVAYATVTCGSYVKAHKIETIYAGAGSHVFANAREAAIRANARAADAPGAAQRTAGASVSATDGSGPAGSARPAGDIADQLVRLAQLRDAGIVTADEFAAKKAELLARM
jgi:Short C-terminal domain